MKEPFIIAHFIKRKFAENPKQNWQTEDDGDDIYIMVKCLCVCNENAYFRIQKIWSFLMFIATFHTQRNWPFLLFPGTFRTQRIWSFPCFLRLLCSKDLVISHVYRHFPNSKVSGNSKTTKFFNLSQKSLFCIQKIWSFHTFIATFCT